jgi:hypothetical protein
MLAYRVAAACLGAMFVIAVVLAVTHPLAETNDGTVSKSAKLNVPGSQLVAECPKIAWPYGCEWRPAYLNERAPGSDRTG